MPRRVGVLMFVLACGLATAAPAPAADTAPAPTPVFNVSPPIVAGTPTVGSQLISVIGTWDGSTPIYLSRQWQRCPSGAASCVDVPRAVYETYQLGPADVGSQIRVVAHASNAGGATTTPSALFGPITDGSSAPVYDLPAVTPQPGGGPAALAAVFTAPRKAKLRRALAGKLPVEAECTQACKLLARLVVSKAVARKWKVPRTVARRAQTLASPGHTTLRPKFAPKTQKRLAKVKTLNVTLVTEARDRAGKLGSRRTKKLTLVR